MDFKNKYNEFDMEEEYAAFDDEYIELDMEEEDNDEYYYNEFIEECCKFDYKKEYKKRVRIINIYLLIEEEKYCWNGLEMKKMKNYVQNECYINVTRKWNKVIIEFEYNLNNLKMIEKNKKVLDEFISQLKKIGEIKESSNKIELKIDYLKANIYLEKNIYVYIDEQYKRNNEETINNMINNGIRQENILIENSYKSLMPQLENIIRKDELLFLPSINILGNDIFKFLKMCINKKVDFILGEYIGLPGEINQREKYFLINEIEKIFKINKIDFVQLNGMNENVKEVNKKQIIDDSVLDNENYKVEEEFEIANPSDYFK